MYYLYVWVYIYSVLSGDDRPFACRWNNRSYDMQHLSTITDSTYDFAVVEGYLVCAVSEFCFYLKEHLENKP